LLEEGNSIDEVKKKIAQKWSKLLKDIHPTVLSVEITNKFGESTEKEKDRIEEKEKFTYGFERGKCPKCNNKAMYRFPYYNCEKCGLIVGTGEEFIKEYKDK